MISLDLSPYDLVITDFEPITAWAAKLRNKPCMGIGHQYAFGSATPLGGDSFISRLILKNFAPATKSIGLHWSDYDDNILPPIIDTQLRASKKKEHIIVYLPFEDQQSVISLLNEVDEYEFIFYSPDYEEGEYANVTVYKTNYLGFKRDLSAASGVICNSGFELISECLHLGLPILTKALGGQMEQHSNALALRQLSYANVVDELSVAHINSWLSCTNNKLLKPWPDVALAISQMIVNDNWQHFSEIKADLWQQA